MNTKMQSNLMPMWIQLLIALLLHFPPSCSSSAQGKLVKASHIADTRRRTTTTNIKKAAPRTGISVEQQQQQQWVQSFSIQPIHLYDPYSSALPGRPFFSGFQTALNKNGNVLAIASKLNNNVSSGGLVQVFTLDESSSSTPNAWVQLGSDIIISTFGDWYGSKILALDEPGSIIAIGSRLAANEMGNVQILHLKDDTGKWTLMGNIIEGSQEGEHMGAALDLSSLGNTIAIGSPFYNRNVIESGQDLNFIGRVTIWEYDPSAELWTKSADLYGESANDEFGTTLAISGTADVLTVGAPSNDGNGANAGHVRYFEYHVGTGGWLQLDTDIDGEQFSDYSGSAIAMGKDKYSSGSNISSNGSEGYRIAIGAYMNDGETPLSNEQLDNRGHVRLYDYDRVSSKWDQIGLDINGKMPNDFSGGSIAVDRLGNRVIIGATGNDGCGVNAGHARVYKLSSQEQWELLGNELSGEREWDQFGESVQMNAAGDRVVVGAPRYGADGDGKVYIFDLIVVAESPSTSPTSNSRHTNRNSWSVSSIAWGMIAVLGIVFM